MFDIAAIAASHNVKEDHLAADLARAGWDFSKLDETNPKEIEFATRTATMYAKRMAAAAKRRAAREAREAAQREAQLTSAARAYPHLTCNRCDGKGHVRGFGHIENGRCFACNGNGIIRY
jgi:hypothetical protein